MINTLLKKSASYMKERNRSSSNVFLTKTRRKQQIILIEFCFDEFEITIFRALSSISTRNFTKVKIISYGKMDNQHLAKKSFALFESMFLATKEFQQKTVQQITNIVSMKVNEVTGLHVTKKMLAKKFCCIVAPNHWRFIEDCNCLSLKK